MSLLVAFLHLFPSIFCLASFSLSAPPLLPLILSKLGVKKDIVEYWFTLLMGECLSLLFLSLYLSWEDLPTRPQSFPDHFTTAAQSTPLSSCFSVCLWTHRVSACLLGMKGILRNTLPLKDSSPPLSFFSLDPILFWASSVSDVFTRCCIEQF